MQSWYDIRKYYVRDEDIEKMLNSNNEDVDEVNIESIEISRDEECDFLTASQVNYMIKTIAERPELVSSDMSVSVCNKLNNIGPSSKTPLDWKKIWTDYKSKVKCLGDRNGCNKLNHLQRLTYELIKRESGKGVNSTMLVRFQLISISFNQST